MKISVYAICKNEELFIEDMIKSCYEADEIVICDTGSSDRTIDIIKQYNVKLLMSKTFICFFANQTLHFHMLTNTE